MGHADFHHVYHDSNSSDKTRTARAREESLSEFPLEICREFAAHLKASGAGIIEPFAYGKAIWLSGEDDGRIREWQESKAPPTTAAFDRPLPGEPAPELLEKLLLEIGKRMNSDSFDTWFKPIEALSRDDTEIFLRVPTVVVDGRIYKPDEVRDLIVNNYLDILDESIEELEEEFELEGYQIEWVVNQSKEAKAYVDSSKQSFENARPAKRKASA